MELKEMKLKNGMKKFKEDIYIYIYIYIYKHIWLLEI